MTTPSSNLKHHICISPHKPSISIATHNAETIHIATSIHPIKYIKTKPKINYWYDYTTDSIYSVIPLGGYCNMSYLSDFALKNLHKSIKDMLDIMGLEHQIGNRT